MKTFTAARADTIFFNSSTNNGILPQSQVKYFAFAQR